MPKQLPQTDVQNTAEPVYLVNADGTLIASGTPVAVSAGPPTSVTATIANGTSLSGAAQVSGKVVGVITPAAWTAAAMTFSVSQDNVTYINLYDDATERTIASASIPTAESRMLALSLVNWLTVNWIKVRSGTAAAAVNQGAARSVILVLAG